METKLFFSYFLLNLFFKFIYGDPLLIEIGNSTSGSINESLIPLYYKFLVSSNLNKNDIIINLYPKDELENFCDPDLFISKNNSTPNSKSNSNWFSTSYGQDSIVIPSKDFSLNETIYIGIVSRSKCKFDLSVKFEIEIEILSESKITYISKGVNFLGYVWNNVSNSSSLVIITRTFSLSEFRLYVGINETPSNDINSISGKPGWFEGQYVKISKSNPKFCINCKYKVLITSEEKLLFPIFISYIISNDIQQIDSNSRWPILGLLVDSAMLCYSYNVDQSMKSENLIVSLSTFSGALKKLYVTQSKPSERNDLSTIKLNYSLNEEDVIKLTPENRKQINFETGYLYFCFKSNVYYDTTFYLKIMAESKIEDFQRGNFIINGVSLNGYLPADKVTRYRAIDFTTTANITLKLETVSGSPILYANVKEDSYQIYSKEELNRIKDNLFKAIKNGNIQTIQINSDQNPCHSLNKAAFKPNFRCGVSAIIYCNGTIECIYRISDKSRKTYNLIKEHKIENHLVSNFETDYYRFNIENDTDIENVTIILASINGDADLYTSRSVQKPTYNNSDKVSILPAFSPDIVVYSKKDASNNSLKGDYYIAIYSFSYTYYSIMYYTTKSTENIDVNNDIVSSLVNGIFVKDFLNPTKNFKIYKFDTNFEESNKKDIQIILSSERGSFKMFLYDDQSKIKYSNDTNNNTFSINLNFNGFISSSNNYLSQININKTSSYYKTKGTYFLVVYLSNMFNLIEENALYSLAYKSEDSKFVLNDGVPINFFLENSFQNESFVYYHYQTNNSLLLSVGSSYGSLKFYYDFKDFKQNYEDAENKISVTDHFQVPTNLIVEKCKGQFPCSIFVGLKTDNYWGEFFYLIAKTVNMKPILYTSGIIQNQNLLIDEIQYYYIRVGKDDQGQISVGFISGRISAFVNILPPSKLNDPQRRWDYPTSEKNKYVSDNYYYGQTIFISEDDLKDCNPQCILLVGVKGLSTYGYGTSSIKYTFKYNSRISQIYDNIPIMGSLIEGETQYYTFYSNQNVQNIYISSISINAGGDTDLMVNYGQIFPLGDKNDWRSITPYAEFIDINKDDAFFSTKGVTINNSNYTIGIYGYSKTTFSLFVTTNPKKILPVSDYHSNSCLTKNKDDYCYFRYTQLFSNSWNWSTLSFTDEILASSEFLYGNGTIYAKVYDTSVMDLYKDVPTKDNYDFSSNDQNFINFIEINRNNLKGKFTKNNTKYTILFSVYCNNPCFVTLNTDSKYLSNYKYLNLNRENLVYVRKKSSLRMEVSYYERNNLTINTGLISGSGSFKLLTYSNNGKNTTLATFSLNAANQRNYQFISENYQGQLFLDVDVDNYDSAFSVKISYYHNWTNIIVGKSQSFISELERDFLAYFYFPKLYQSITINLHPKNHNTAATISANIFRVDKYKSLKNILIPPDQENTQFQASTDYNLQSAILNINNTWKDYSEKDNIICLISIRLTQYKNFSNNLVINPFINSQNSSSIFTITVTSEQNNMSYLPLVPNILHSSMLGYMAGKFDLYEIKPTNSDNDFLMIEIYNCNVNVLYLLTEKVTKEGTTKEEESNYIINKYKGKKVLTTKVNAGIIHYLKIYIDPQEEIESKCLNSTLKCTQYMIRYISGNSVDMVSFIPYAGVDLISWKNDVSDNLNISWNKMIKIKEDDSSYVPQEALAKYSIFYSNKKADYENMQSFCYLVSNIYNKLLGSTQSTSLNTVLEPNKKYYINVMAVSLENGESYVYSPIEIIFIANGLSIIVPIIGFILILILGYGVFFLYQKYTMTRRRLDFEMQDVRNMANIPNTEEQINNAQTMKKSNQYATLTEEGNVSKI